MLIQTSPHTNSQPATGNTDPCAHLLLDETRLQRLAIELARDIYPLALVVKHYGIDEEVFEAQVRNHPRFMMFFAEAHSMWNGSSSVATRSQVMAGVLFETWLREANRLLHDPQQPMAPKVELGKFLANVGGIIKEKGAVQPGERTVININLGEGRRIHIDKEVPREPPREIEGTIVSST